MSNGHVTRERPRTGRDDPWPGIPEARRNVMRANKNKNTKPEMTVRRLLHGLGYRFRLHCKDLPGSPDLVFPSRRKVVFVHGCYWHGHLGCRRANIPKTRALYWCGKIQANKDRDLRNLAQLEAMGWQSLVIWECELDIPDNAAQRSREFLGAPGTPLRGMQSGQNRAIRGNA
jgi:DNA mismatch endonuclease (patch repair protein)